MNPVKSKDFITILENNIDLSRLELTAFEINRKINKDIINNLVHKHYLSSNKYKSKRIVTKFTDVYYLFTQSGREDNLFY